MGDHKPGSKSVRRKMEGKEKDSIHEDLTKPHPQFWRLWKGLDIFQIFLQLIFFPRDIFSQKRMRVIQKVKIAKKGNNL